MRTHENVRSSAIRKTLVTVTLVALLLAGCSRQTATPAASAVTAPPLELFSNKSVGQESTYVSADLVVDDVFKSMLGPGRQDYLALDPEKSELAWLTGFSVEVVKPDGETPLSQQYLCHSNLEIADVNQHYMKVANRAFNPGRYFTISQGQTRAQLPDGFGIPISTAHALNWSGQALNLNGKPEKPIVTRQKVLLDYTLDKDLKSPMQPLFAMSLVGLKTIGELPKNYTMSHQPGHTEGSGCLVGTSAVVDGVFTDNAGNQFTAHWVVEPGIEENKTLLDDIFTLPYDTTLHYAMLHVHAFCQSVELYDLTADKPVLKFDCTQYPDKVGLLKTQELSSVEGIPMYKDHSYELRSVYNNTTDEEQDSMVVLYVYLKDKDFDKTKLTAQR